MQVKWKIWIEKDGKHVMGKGGYEILKAIKDCGSILKASKELGMSYKFIWDYLRRMEKVLGEKVVISERGGSKGGKTVLTPLGEELINTFESFEKMIRSMLQGSAGVVKDIKGSDILIKVENADLKVGDSVLVISLK